MGLGVLGRGIQVTKFLAECGAKLTVTDLKGKNDLRSALKVLKKYNIRYVLGKHDLSDFEHADMVIKAGGVPLDSPYIKHARSRGIPIAMDASIFAKIAKDVTIIGITGTRGKSMTTALIYHILKSNESVLKHKVYLGGNMRNTATLPLLKKVLPGDIAVLELDSWQCQGFGDEKLSPHIAVFTSFMPDHMNYYKNSMKKYLADKANIFKFQKPNDILVTNKDLLKIIPKTYKGRVILAKNVPETEMNIFGTHNLQNASYAYSVAKHVGLSDSQIKKALQSFPGLDGRLQFLKNVGGIRIINDNNATTPEATIAGIEAVREKYSGNIILIAGGADKKLKLDNLIKTIKKYCHSVILLSGSGTERLKEDIKHAEYSNLQEASAAAYKIAKKNDTILFSPGFASFGMFTNEYDRNDQFVKIIKKWK